jgi:hypothetical protein
MVYRFREFEKELLQTHQRTKKQIIFALTANDADISLMSRFDGVYSKPLSLIRICDVIEQYFS